MIRSLEFSNLGPCFSLFHYESLLNDYRKGLIVISLSEESICNQSFETLNDLAPEYLCNVFTRTRLLGISLRIHFNTETATECFQCFGAVLECDKRCKQMLSLRLESSKFSLGR